jgi:hypothetical protein
MPETTKNWPALIRELAQQAQSEGKSLPDLAAELTDELGPVPLPPVGYSLAHGCDELWVGAEITNEKYTITPSWNATTNTHTVELWLSEDAQPLTTTEAFKLGLDLAKAANDAVPVPRNPERKA